MVGQGVLRECLIDHRVSALTSVVRAPTGRRDAKLTELVLPDLAAVATLSEPLAGFDACFFCVGVSSAGMSEESYRRQTYDLTLEVATVLARLNPSMTFVYVSGAGTDERSRFMWARVKGKTETDLQALPFKAVYLFRPGAIQPLHGARSRTAWYRALYAVTGPIYPVLRHILPSTLTTTEQVGRAMIGVAERGYPRPVLEVADINAVV